MVIYFFYGYTGIDDPSKELFASSVFLSLAISMIVAKRFVNKRFEKLDGMEYYPRCYSCGQRRHEDEIECRKCGLSLRIKKIKVPTDSLYKFCIDNILLFFLVAAISICVVQIAQVRNQSKFTMSYVSTSTGNLLKFKYDHRIGGKVKYNNAIATVAAVGVDNKHNIIYTIDVNGQKIYGVAASELQKVSLPEN